MGKLILAMMAVCALSCASADVSRKESSSAKGAAPVAGGGTAAAAHHAIVRPDRIEWRDGPPSLPAGAKFVVLEGDPAKEGFFAMRAKMPDGFRIPPHWHPGVERITVISGTFHLGHGETFDRSAVEALPAGTYSAMPPGMRHFGWAEGETVIQVTTNGPWGINYVNPADDPRKR